MPDPLHGLDDFISSILEPGRNAILPLEQWRNVRDKWIDPPSAVKSEGSPLLVGDDQLLLPPSCRRQRHCLSYIASSPVVAASRICPASAAIFASASAQWPRIGAVSVTSWARPGRCKDNPT